MSGRDFTIERFDEISSTNTYLLDQARSGAPGGLVAVADHQTAGRGRLDRRWESPAGSSLLASILLREVLVADDAHLLTAAVALAAAEAAESLCGVRPRLKWPNDLVVEGAKVAGILAEADAGAPGGPPGSTAIVVGLGLNLTWPGPPGVGGTSLLEVSGVTVDRDELLAHLLDGLGRRLDLIADGAGRSLLATEVEAALVTLGQVVSVATATETVTGRALGLSTSGHLLVEGPGGVVEIVTGDVVQVRPAPEGDEAAE